ncbi:MAG: AAA-like domain-containing protein [bacterium]
MREFNTSGPCDPRLHYMVRREELIKVGRKMVEKGKFFSIWAPRQTGKTTYFRLLSANLKTNPEYIPVWINLEAFKNLPPDKFLFYLKQAILRGIKDTVIKDRLQQQELTNLLDLYPFFTLGEEKKRIVLIIDEIDGCPESIISDLMHTFRDMYHNKDNHNLHSLIIVGVSNISGLIMNHASPFNVADELSIPYFTKNEVTELISQYEKESGQDFEPRVLEKIYQETAGQPGLICGICKDLIERFCPDHSQPVTIQAFWKCLDYYLKDKIDKNISNIVAKAKQEKELILKILFSEEMPYTIYDERVKFLLVNGVIERIGDYVDVQVPLYKEALITAFRPLSNGEKQYYLGIKEGFERFLIRDDLKIELFLDNYQAYIQKRGFRAFDVNNLRESAWHYSLDSYLFFFIEEMGGKVLVEVPTGRGRIDILIIYNKKQYVIETKIYRNKSSYEKGKRQLAAYLKSEGLKIGYYVVFSNIHTEEDILKEKEELEGKIIYSYIIRTNIEPVTG